MVANKVRGVRCALCWNEESARLSRQHNDANVLSLGERLVAEDLALQIVRIWLTTEFEGGRHARRIAQIGAMNLKPAIEANRDEKDSADKSVALEKGAIDRGDIKIFRALRCSKKKRDRDQWQRAEIDYAQVRKETKGNQRDERRAGVAIVRAASFAESQVRRQATANFPGDRNHNPAWRR